MATFLSCLQSVAGAKRGHKGVFTAFSILHIQELKASLVQALQNDLFSSCSPASCLQSGRAGARARARALCTLPGETPLRWQSAGQGSYQPALLALGLGKSPITRPASSPLLLVSSPNLLFPEVAAPWATFQL